jgi:hypothetical protein
MVSAPQVLTILGLAATQVMAIIDPSLAKTPVSPSDLPHFNTVRIDINVYLLANGMELLEQLCLQRKRDCDPRCCKCHRFKWP